MKLPSWLTAVPPDPRAYGHLVQLCADSGHLAAGRQLHARLVALSVTPSNFLASKLISLYSRAARLDDARRVFDAIPQPSVFAWNAILIALSLHSPDPSASSPPPASLPTRSRSLRSSSRSPSPDRGCLHSSLRSSTPSRSSAALGTTCSCPMVSSPRTRTTEIRGLLD